MYEVAGGTPLVDVVERADGLATDVRAVLVGGYFGRWMPAERAAGLRLGHGELGALGVTLGWGVVITLLSRACCLAGQSYGAVHDGDRLAARNSAVSCCLRMPGRGRAVSPAPTCMVVAAA